MASLTGRHTPSAQDEEEMSESEELLSTDLSASEDQSETEPEGRQVLRKPHPFQQRNYDVNEVKLDFVELK